MKLLVICSAVVLVGAAGCEVEVTGARCGDGRLDLALLEQCDCGTNPNALPAGCTAVNGAPGGECSAGCALRCGNGIVEFGEECDCGLDDNNVPLGCLDVNGATGSGCNLNCTRNPVCGDNIVDTAQGETCDPPNGTTCDTSCQDIIQCNTNVWESGCSSTSFTDCCDDDYGASTACVTLGQDNPTNYCLRECSTANDCYWSNDCFPGAGNTCLPNLCGPGSNSANLQLQSPCVGPHNTPGFCVPIYSRDTPSEDFLGICFEFGTLAHGADCSHFDDSTVTDLSVDVCNQGFCHSGVGQCLQFCDWEKVYATQIYDATNVTLNYGGCPTGSNCWSQSGLNPTTGLRTADLGFCFPEASGQSCSLVSSQLISDPSQTCHDVQANARCAYVEFQDGTRTIGSLMGFCEPSNAANAAVWGACTPGTTICPSGSECHPEDGVGGSGANRCVPYCDTQRHLSGADCVGLGAQATGGATPMCQSFSDFLAPTDSQKTRLGICTF